MQSIKVLGVIWVAISIAACNATLQELSRKAGEQIGTPSTGGSPTATEMAAALREALSQGVNSSIRRLGRSGGFSANEAVRIPVPEDLRKAADLLERAGQGRYVDEFVTSLNRAAEQAVPEAGSIFMGAIRRMSIDDALNIIKGPQDAATQYFRETSEAQLHALFRPVVARATDAVGVTRSYKAMLDKTGPVKGLLSKDAVDVDGYVTREATDALFSYIAEEERRIRENPVARTTELLKKVFGYYGR